MCMVVKSQSSQEALTKETAFEETAEEVKKKSCRFLWEEHFTKSDKQG